MKEVIEAFNNSAVLKVSKLNHNKKKYYMMTMLAGMFVGFGVLLIYTIGGLLAPSGFAGTKVVMGLSFSVALSLVMMAGADLFTGNTMTMTIGTLSKKTTWTDTLRIWGHSYVGNFIGSVILAALFVFSGLTVGGTGDYINETASLKMNAPFMELLFRGILCNILVCLGVWCSFKLKDETAKLIMIFWCIYTFITAGFEHSVANMTLLSISLMIPHPETVSLAGMAANLIPVSIGNIIGGAIFVGAAYWFGITNSTKASSES